MTSDEFWQDWCRECWGEGSNSYRVDNDWKTFPCDPCGGSGIREMAQLAI